MELHDLFGRTVRIECDTGLIIEGLVHTYTSEEDNDPEPESVCVGNYELTQSDIKNITIIK